MAAASSSAAVAALVQKASQQYMECRRKVTAKVDEVRAIEEQLGAAFAAMDLLRERGGASAKSVGRLTLTLAAVEGAAPVPAAAISVAIEPEFEADEDDFEEVEEVVEKRDVVTTDEHGHVVEAGAVPLEHEAGETPRKLKTTTKITRTIIKKKVKKARAPVVRTVAWDAVAVEDEAETEAQEQEQGSEEEQTESDEQKKEAEEEAAPKPLSFPATFVFDPVQSREAVIVITVASASEEDAEPVKEIEIPVSSLFGEDAKLDKWYSFADESATAAVVEAAEEVSEATAEAVEMAEQIEEAEKIEEAEEVEKTEEAEKTEDNEVVEDKEEETADAEKADKEEKEVTAESEDATEDEVAEATEEQTVDAVVEEEPATPVSRFHVQASFVMSDIEKLSAAAMALSKKKQEADVILQALEREAASLRTKYERLNASQRTLSSSGVSKPKSGLLSSRFGQPVVQKSQFQKLRESFSAVFTPQRQQVLTSVAIFVTSVAVFHYQGENLLM